AEDGIRDYKVTGVRRVLFRSHLLMKLRAGFRRWETRPGQDVWMIEIHRRIAALARRIDVDHFDIFADRARLEVLFPAYIERCLRSEERRVGKKCYVGCDVVSA